MLRFLSYNNLLTCIYCKALYTFGETKLHSRFSYCLVPLSSYHEFCHTSTLRILKDLVDDSNTNVSEVCNFEAMNKFNYCLLIQNSFYP